MSDGSAIVDFDGSAGPTMDAGIDERANEASTPPRDPSPAAEHHECDLQTNTTHSHRRATLTHKHLPAITVTNNDAPVSPSKLTSGSNSPLVESPQTLISSVGGLPSPIAMACDDSRATTPPNIHDPDHPRTHNSAITPPAASPLAPPPIHIETSTPSQSVVNLVYEVDDMHGSSSPALSAALRNDPLSSPTPLNLSRPTGDHTRRPSIASSGDHSSFVTLPSPTLSASSHRFATSVALRDNRPEHFKKPSYASFSKGLTGGPELVEVTPRTTSSLPGLADPPPLTQTDWDVHSSTHPAPPFAFRPSELTRMFGPKDLRFLTFLGGVSGLLNGLGTRQAKGLPVLDRINSFTSSSSGSAQSSRGEDDNPGPAFRATLSQRRRIYGENVLPHSSDHHPGLFLWHTFKDYALIFLLIATAIKLVLGLFETTARPKRPQREPVDWVEGVATVVTVVVIILVELLVDWNSERHIDVLRQARETRKVKVIRDLPQVIDTKELVVGDVALLEPGDIVPCDGVFLEGYNVVCDESGVTGEANLISKRSYDDYLALLNGRPTQQDSYIAGHEGVSYHDCFILSGSKVVQGYGRYVIVAVGRRSFHSRALMALSQSHGGKPQQLQLKLNDFSTRLAKLGCAATLLFFTATMIEFLIQFGKWGSKLSPMEKGLVFFNNFTVTSVLLFVTVPAVSPLVLSQALAFAAKRLKCNRILIRSLGSCETMAHTSVICTGLASCLTQKMCVVAGSIGINMKFARNADTRADPINTERPITEFCGERPSPPPAPDLQVHTQFPYQGCTVDLSQVNELLPPQLRMLLNQAICVTSTAFERQDSGLPVFTGHKMEVALLSFAKQLGWQDWNITREAAQIEQISTFCDREKVMSVAVRLPSGRWRVFWRGASEQLVKRCTRHVTLRQDERHYESGCEGISSAAVDDPALDNIQRSIISYAEMGHRTVALCYRDFDIWPPAGARFISRDKVACDDLCEDLVLIAVFAIQDPLRSGVRTAVEQCRRAGVTVKMCTRENVLTARAVASQCGIYFPGGLIMEGPQFRQLSDHQMLAILPQLQVLARASSEDKLMLVQRLKQLGEVVAVTGSGVNDDLALSAADVGFSAGLECAETAKQASDITLMDPDFASLAWTIAWGRCVNDSVRKFLQFQITTSIASAMITFISALVAMASNQCPILSVVELLWIYLIIDAFTALALTTDLASNKLWDRKPATKSAPLLNVDVCKQILFQSIYHIGVVLALFFAGSRILRFPAHPADPQTGAHYQNVIRTMAYNTFIFLQIFNGFNCRRADNKLNIFEGITRNYYFIILIILEICVQVLIIQCGGTLLFVTPLRGREWGISLGAAAGSIPLGALVRLLPNPPFSYIFSYLKLLPKSDVLPTAQPVPGPDSVQLRDSLYEFSRVRGGRMKYSSFVTRNRYVAAPPPSTSPLLTMIPMVSVPSTSLPVRQNSYLSSNPAFAEAS